VGPLLIRPHQARVPRHVGGEDRGEAADRRHLSRSGRVGLTKSTPKPGSDPSADRGAPMREMPPYRASALPTPRG
jgi:hypothetical protein